jgi:hypothetical protein
VKTDPGQQPTLPHLSVPEHVPSITTAAVVVRREIELRIVRQDETLSIHLSTATVGTFCLVLSCATLTITTRDPRLQS